MRPLPRVTFVIDDFKVPSPGQQLLDRFLMGYNSDGNFRVPGCEVAVFTRTPQAFQSRVREFDLRIISNLKDERSIVLTGEAQSLNDLASGSRCFVCGLLASNAQAARELAQAAEARGIIVRTASATETAFRLPPLEVSEGTIRKALVVTTGGEPELDGLHALRSLAPSRLTFTRVRPLIWRDVWETAYSRDWYPLFAAAVSRSNTMQGDPEKDGRTQDIAGLRIVEKLVKQARAWLIDHSDGMQTAIFDLNGALEDLNFAAELMTGSIVSTQLYRPPLPMQDHFSPLAERIERFFRMDVAASSPDLTLLPALYERIRT